MGREGEEMFKNLNIKTWMLWLMCIIALRVRQVDHKSQFSLHPVGRAHFKDRKIKSNQIDKPKQ
jgi:hypothetical protein